MSASTSLEDRLAFLRSQDPKVIDSWPEWEKTILRKMGFMKKEIPSKDAPFGFSHCSNLLEVFPDGRFIVRSKGGINNEGKYSGKISTIIAKLQKYGIIKGEKK